MIPLFPNRASLPAAIIMLALLLLSACGGEKTKAKKERIVPVTVAKVQREDVPYELSAVGNVTPLATVEIKPRVGGGIVEQLVQNGQEVKQGDLLFRIDSRPFDLAIKEAQAKLERDRAHLTKARQDLKRSSKLRQLNVVAQEQYDNTYAESTSLENTIRLNEATLERAQLDREYAMITAPISGRVGIVQVNVGNVIKANDDRTLCVINQIRPINISFSLPERYLGEVMVQQAKSPLHVEISPPGTDAKAVAAISAVDNAVDTATGTIRLVATYPNDDDRFWPGQFARVRLILRVIKDALLVPTRAVLQGLEGSYVYVVAPDPDGKGGTVRPRNVKTAHIVGLRTVITEGLEQNEFVVLDGQLGLSPGARVSIRQSTQGGSAQAGTAASKTAGKAQ
ncbi:efflux RND transporter periplasmic adaptor subunit [Pseudodesulfovibrio sp.]|uniref:efflux RND transporter periplasmic adaptor subunit n=1 Tax=unclassified Pseudodesulfovibrio TaxID=2661612 RepID=UPI003B006372